MTQLPSRKMDRASARGGGGEGNTLKPNVSKMGGPDLAPKEGMGVPSAFPQAFRGAPKKPSGQSSSHRRAPSRLGGATAPALRSVVGGREALSWWYPNFAGEGAVRSRQFRKDRDSPSQRSGRGRLCRSLHCFG